MADKQIPANPAHQLRAEASIIRVYWENAECLCDASVGHICERCGFINSANIIEAIADNLEKTQMICDTCGGHFPKGDPIITYETNGDTVSTFHGHQCPNCLNRTTIHVRDEEVKDWYFTFGFGHAYSGHYHVIRGGYGQARYEMFRRFGDKWAFQYDSASKAGVKEYGLKQLS